MIRRTAALVLLLIVSPAGFHPLLAGAAEPRGFAYVPGERYVFLGDSITEQYQYSTYIELYLTTRFPDGKMSFYNAGIGGDVAVNGARRFASHVLAEKPNVVTIDFGMNDGGYGGFDPKKDEEYIKATEQMLQSAKKAGVRAILISPNAVEVRSRPNLTSYLETQAKFYAPLKELAAKYDVPFVDQYTVTRKVLEKIAADDAKVKPFPDGVHTSPAGALLMAHTILLGAGTGVPLSRIEIDVPKGKLEVHGADTETGKLSPDYVSFTRGDNALPMPMLKEWREMLPYVDQLKDLNDYALQVKGLKAGKYQLTIDGEPVAAYTADELAAGVNIGLAEKGPIFDQGMKVLAAINAKNDIVHKRFREVVMFDARQLPDWVAGSRAEVARKRRAELAKREEQIEAKQAEVYRLATPVSHRWEVKRAD